MLTPHNWIIRPHLEYAVYFWSTHDIRGIELRENAHKENYYIVEGTALCGATRKTQLYYAG